ncbi:MAG TPA: arsenic resistance N-acetyltransferase ArsN2 [Gammaproteobacteria bacterium]
MTDTPDFRAATANDLADIQALLKSAGLPFEDLTIHSLQDFMVLRDAKGELLATGGVERHGNDGLLRSVVVSDAARGSGLGKRITGAIENHAREKHIGALYLLTMTAAEFFPRLGYEKFDRDAVPVAIARSTEFATLCPATAICMKKNLG